MARITYVDVPAARAAADKLHALIEDFHRSLEAMKRKQEEHFGCWGTDDAGVAFATDYVPNSTDLLKALTENLEGFEGQEEFLRGAIEAFQRLDEQAGQYLSYQDPA